MKGYGTNYKPLGKNDGVAYFDKPIEDLIASEGYIGEALPQKIQYTLPRDNLEVFAPIDGEIQYIKLELEDSKNTILYFYRNDMSEVLAVNKENDLQMTGTFTMDYYYTYFYDMANIIENINPDVYFLRRFAGRFDEGTLATNLHERGGFKNALPININPDYKTMIDVPNSSLMALNNISNFSVSPGYVKTPKPKIELSQIQVGDSFQYAIISQDFKPHFSNSILYDIILSNGQTPPQPPSTDGILAVGPELFAKVPGTSDSITLALAADFKNYSGGASSSINGVSGDASTKTVYGDIPQTVNSIMRDYPNYNGSFTFYNDNPHAENLTTTFESQSIGNKYRYAVVSKSAFKNPYMESSFTQNGVDLVVIPIPVKDFTVTDSEGSSTSYSIDTFNTALYNISSLQDDNFIGSEDTVKACFESPICFDLIAKDNNAYYTMILAADGTTAPLFFYPLTSLKGDSYIELNLHSLSSFTSYETGDQYNEPYLLYNNQFRRYVIGTEHGLELPLYNFEYKLNTPIPISAFLLINNDMKLGLNPEGFSDGSEIYQDRFEFQMKLSNNIIKDCSAYNNGLVNNILTEQTARANLQDQKTIMQRQQAMNGLGVANQATNTIFGDYDASNYVPYGKGAGSKALKRVPGTDYMGMASDIAGLGFNAVSTYLQNKNLSTEFGIKQRNVNTQFANIRKSPASITNQDCDKEMIPFLTDGIRVIDYELTPAQKNVVMQEIYNYGYAYDGVAPFREYNNRGLYNVIQINTDYNREHLESIIKENYTGIGNYRNAIDNFLDWMGSIHRVYKTDTFDVDPTQNIEIKIRQPSYQIVPETYTDIDNLVHGVATMKLPDGSLYAKEGTLDLNTTKTDVNSILVDFSDLPGGEEQEFKVEGKYTPVTIDYNIVPIEFKDDSNAVDGTATMTTTAGFETPKNIGDLIVGDEITKITFGDGFQLLENYSENENMRFTDASYFGLTTDYTLVYQSVDGSDLYTIYTLGAFQASHTFNDGTTGDLDSKTLTLGSTKTILSNAIQNSNYLGIVYGYIISRKNTKYNTHHLHTYTSSGTVDFRDVRYGENHQFAVDGQYTYHTSSVNIRDVQISQYIDKIVFPSNWAGNTRSGSVGIPGVTGGDVSLSGMTNVPGTKNEYGLRLGTNGIWRKDSTGKYTGFQNSFTLNGYVGDKDTLTLTMPQPLPVVTQIYDRSSEYTGDVFAYIMV